MKSKKITKDEVKIILLFLLILLIMLLYFSYKLNVTNLVNAQKIGAYIIIFLVTTISFISIMYLYQKKNIKVENVFLAIAIIFCVLMYLAMPITKAHDEEIHGYRIFEYASGKLINNGKSVTLSEGILEALHNKQFYHNIFLHDNTYSTQTSKVTYEYRMSHYSPISYLPHILGVCTSSIFTSNAMVQVYVARLFNMIACITMLYFAIKIIPYGKNMLFLIALIPIAIEGYISLSADGIAISSSILFISYILKLREDKNAVIGYKQIMILTILSIVVAISKIVYFPIVLFSFILPKEKFKNNKKWIPLICIFVISVIIDVLWYYYGMEEITFGRTEEVSSHTFQGIMMQPITYIKQVLYTIVYRFNNYFNELFGGKLEYNENVTIPIFPYLIALGTILISRNKEKQSYNFYNFEKILLSIIIVSIIILVISSMYIDWSPIESAYIAGVQGRYFLPILPLITLLFANGFSDEEKTTKKIAIFISIMQIFVITELFIFHT